MIAALFGFLLVILALLCLIALGLGAQIRQPWPALSGVGAFALLCLVPGVRLIRSSGRSLRPARVSLIGLVVFVVASIGVLGWLRHRGIAEPGKVRLADGVLLIQGPLDLDLLAEFRRVTGSADLSGVRVRLRSPGGNTYVGMAIGREIHRWNLDVEVDLHCISSCANYLFTAGRNKYVQSPDQVVFHGGALQPDIVASALEWIAQGKQTDSGDDIPAGLDLAQMRMLCGLVDDLPINKAVNILAEKAYFEEIGVSSLTPVTGQYGEFAAWFKDGVHDDFYYLPEDYGLLGVTNVIVTGPESAGGPGSRLFRARNSAASIEAVQAQVNEIYRKVEEALPLRASDIWLPVAP